MFNCARYNLDRPCDIRGAIWKIGIFNGLLRRDFCAFLLGIFEITMYTKWTIIIKCLVKTKEKIEIYQMLCEKVQIITLRIVSKLSDIKWFFFQVFYIQYQNDLISIPSDNILDFLIS